jgi:hypothetical protein
MRKTNLTLLILFGFAIFHIAVAQSAIYISQVQVTGGKNNTNADFVEFFNPNSSPVNLKGYRLVKRPGNAESDTLVKSWSKDTFIPAKSFYLWANSGYVNIAAKPDAVSSATLSDNGGVALRMGAVNSGAIADAISWGKTDNSFNSVSATNPGANLALVRKDLYQAPSGFAISAASPHNSLMNDLAAAFQASQETDAVIKNTAGNKILPTVDPRPPVATVTAEAIDANGGQVESDNIIAPSTDERDSSSEPQYTSQNPQSQSAKPGAKKYLIMSGIALLALILLAKKFLFTKHQTK